ncbi:DUF2637 domain-containing protein [Streptomyces gamaensis]|uniref:DUF2637 domain-containing protein n=1 Tax=Streptomyces gamaensis TaxID=1763542 RepID=A0ABW0ZA97_9ACTN
MNRKGKPLLVVALIAVVAMAFRVSWNALRDVARAIGADSTAATLYPFVVDGLMALALIAALVLTDKRDKGVALRVLGAYTVASLVLNYVHGLVPALHRSAVDWGRLADWSPANWALVLLATSLPVGSIYFGSDLVAKVLHHHPTPVTNAEKSTETRVNQSIADLVESTSEQVPGTPTLKALPVPVDFVKSALPLKSAPTTAPAVGQHPAADQSPRSPRRATGQVPAVARSPRPKRTANELLDQARTATADWSDAKLTAEGIRLAVRTSPKNARALRDALRAERANKVA